MQEVTLRRVRKIGYSYAKLKKRDNQVTLRKKLLLKYIRQVYTK